MVENSLIMVFRLKYFWCVRKHLIFLQYCFKLRIWHYERLVIPATSHRILIIIASAFYKQRVDMHRGNVSRGAGDKKLQVGDPLWLGHAVN